MKILNECSDCQELQDLISTCKSDSGVQGRELREAHRRSGRMIGNEILTDRPDGDRFAVVCLMRSGEPFGEGIADALDCSLLFLDEKHDIRWKMNDCNNKFINENMDILKESTVILADAVINTGETIKQIHDTLIKVTDSIIIAANVIQKEFEPDGRVVYGMRRSENKFKGSKVAVQSGNKGPDTGDRLFRTLDRSDSRTSLCHNLILVPSDTICRCSLHRSIQGGATERYERFSAPPPPSLRCSTVLGTRSGSRWILADCSD